MDLTSAFNDAAGPSGDAGAVDGGPSPHTPSAPAATSAEFSGDRSATTSSEHSSTEATTEFTKSADQLQPEPAVEKARAPSRTLTVAAATSELEMLKDGRAEPAAKHNLNPPRMLKKIVDSNVERRREARIGALKAYLQFKHEHAARDLCLEHGEKLEFGL